MARTKRFGLTGRAREARSEGDNKGHFDAAYFHYVARCKALGIAPMPQDELRALLASAHATSETRPSQI